MYSYSLSGHRGGNKATISLCVDIVYLQLYISQYITVYHSILASSPTVGLQMENSYGYLSAIDYPALIVRLINPLSTEFIFIHVHIVLGVKLIVVNPFTTGT